VVESAYVDGEVRRRAEELGVAGFLSKPLEKYQLMQVLAEALGFREHDPDLSRA
jgi:CheY-like chemotaxis protein